MFLKYYLERMSFSSFVQEACWQLQLNVTSVFATNAVQACRKFIADHMQ